MRCRWNHRNGWTEWTVTNELHWGFSSKAVWLHWTSNIPSLCHCTSLQHRVAVARRWRPVNIGLHNSKLSSLSGETDGMGRCKCQHPQFNCFIIAVWAPLKPCCCYRKKCWIHLAVALDKRIREGLAVVFSLFFAPSLFFSFFSCVMHGMLTGLTALREKSPLIPRGGTEARSAFAHSSPQCFAFFWSYL